MTIDFSITLKQLNGQDLKDEQGVVLSLQTVAIQALLMAGDQNTPADDKVKRFRLAQQIHDETKMRELSLPVEDVALLKKLIGVAYMPLVVGQAFDLLERGKDGPAN